MHCHRIFGNFNFGATGAAAGFSMGTLLRAAGYAQNRAGTSNPAWGYPPNWAGVLLGMGGAGSFGDDPTDQTYIRQGVSYYESL
jgi:type VI secretion system secreted protein VgrG